MGVINICIINNNTTKTMEQKSHDMNNNHNPETMELTNRFKNFIANMHNYQRQKTAHELFYGFSKEEIDKFNDLINPWTNLD